MDSSDGSGDSSPSLPEEYWKAEESIAFWASRPAAGHSPVRISRFRERHPGLLSHLAQLDSRRQFGKHQAPGCHVRSEEHTSELQSLMRISYAVFCLKNKARGTAGTWTNQGRKCTLPTYST